MSQWPSGNDRIPLYLRLASMFRDRISSGAWPVGQQVGPLPELQAEFGVARATIQQAIRLLSDEGLLSSSRGRGTFVTAPSQPVDDPTPSYDQMDLDPRFSIEILSRTPTDNCLDLRMPLPDSAQPFMHVRKRHLLQGKLYSLVDLFLPMEVYKLLPAEEEDSHRLYPQLLRDNIKTERLDGTQTITIALAAQEQAQLLNVSLASPLARVDSQILTESGEQILAQRMFIRGELFSAQRHLTDLANLDPENWRPSAPEQPGSSPQNSGGSK